MTIPSNARQLKPLDFLYIEECQNSSSDFTKDVLDHIYVLLTTKRTLSISSDLNHIPKGLLSYAAHIGICHHGTMDFTLVRLPKDSLASAVYTRSLCVSPAVKFSRQCTQRGAVQLLTVISKNANVFTPTAEDDIQQIAVWLTTEFQIPNRQIIISCTGVIGVPLPMEVIQQAVVGANSRLKPNQLTTSAQAILTTDRQAKMASVVVNEEIVIAGFAKGAGMIEPNMATMLAYIFTNAAIPKLTMDAMLQRAVAVTFNTISVDSDTSTSDTVALISTQEMELNKSLYDDFERALTGICLKLARDIVAQAEGAHKLIEVQVGVPTSVRDATLIAKQIVNSPLVKTAIHGNDPNWGRIVMAIGKPNNVDSLVPYISPQSIVIYMSGQLVYDCGHPISSSMLKLSHAMQKSKTILIKVIIGHEAKFYASAWGCDLSKEYVHINAEYTT